MHDAPTAPDEPRPWIAPTDWPPSVVWAWSFYMGLLVWALMPWGHL